MSNQIITCAFKIDFCDCLGHRKKLRSFIDKIRGVDESSLDREQKKLVVTGRVEKHKLLEKLQECKTLFSVEFWEDEEDSNNSKAQLDDKFKNMALGENNKGSRKGKKPVKKLHEEESDGKISKKGKESREGKEVKDGNGSKKGRKDHMDQIRQMGRGGGNAGQIVPIDSYPMSVRQMGPTSSYPMGYYGNTVGQMGPMGVDPAGQGMMGPVYAYNQQYMMSMMLYRAASWNGMPAVMDQRRPNGYEMYPYPYPYPN